jgi:hypothetical protein
MALSRQVRFMLVASGIITAGAIVSVAVRPPTARQLFFELRDNLQLARQAADDCSVALRAEEDSFRAFRLRTDSVKSRIGSLEGLDRRGVPADSYRVYLEAVDSFNAAVPGWAAAADSIAAHRAACEDLVRSHNVLADSARGLAARANLIDATLDDPEAPGDGPAPADGPAERPRGSQD